MKVYVNGKYYDKDAAVISVYDHGLLYGDGIFEGIRIYNNVIFKLRKHIERLFASAKAVSLDIGKTPAEIISLVKEVVALNNKENGYIRLIVTRGKGDLGVDPSSCKEAGVIIIADDISVFDKSMYENGIGIGISSYRRVPSEVFDPRIKSLNYLNNVLAKIEATQLGYKEALMLNMHGEITECTGDNIFIVKDNLICTPPVSAGVLEGVTRDFVLEELASLLNLNVFEKTLKVYDILTADECFLTGTAVEIMPVTELSGAKIGEGKPGNVTKKLINKFYEVLEQFKDKAA